MSDEDGLESERTIFVITVSMTDRMSVSSPDVISSTIFLLSGSVNPSRAGCSPMLWIKSMTTSRIMSSAGQQLQRM